jgi:hypothetical protein
MAIAFWEIKRSEVPSHCCQEVTILRELHIHVGPHKTGSTSIQNFLADEFSADAAQTSDTLFFDDQVIRGLGQALQDRDWSKAHDEVVRLRELLKHSQAQTVVISSEDLSGGLVGRAGVKRVYPRLSENLGLIDTALGDLFLCKYYFFVRDEDDWLRSVYNQNLAHRQASKDFDQFSQSLRGERSWEKVTAKVRKQLGDRFVLLPYSAAEKQSVVRRFTATAFPTRSFQDRSLDRYWSNQSPDKTTLLMLEVINGSHSSTHAKKIAREHVRDQASNPPTNNPTTLREENTLKFPSHREESNWPGGITRSGEFPEALSSLLSRAENRVHFQDQPNLLPDYSLGFADVRSQLTEGDEEFPGGNRQDMHRQERILKHRFRNRPMVCYYNAFAISYLRRDTQHTAHAKELFLSLWEQEYPVLLATLPTRWLISTLQTFMDHGRSEEQRQVGTAGYFFSNTLKAYEAERAIEGHAADAIYPNTKPTTQNQFPGLDRFPLGNTDLMVNLLALLLEISTRDEVSGRVLIEFLIRTKSAATLFSRMDQSRLHHGVEVPGFQNCWSFFEKPPRKG